MKKFIDIILPYKEIFNKNKASAVSLTILNSFKFSKFKKNIRIFGRFEKNPLLKKNYFSLKTNKFLNLGNNRSLIKSYYNYTKKDNSRKIIEIHNRPIFFKYLIKKKIKHPITIHFHNDPTKMKGSSTIKERHFIANNSAAVYFVSKFIKKKFCLSLNKKYRNLHVIMNGIQRTLKKKPKKNKIILFVGRLIEAKGIILFLNAIEKLLNDNVNWRFLIVGTIKPGYLIRKSYFFLQSKTDRNGLIIIDKIQNLSKKFKNLKHINFCSNKTVQNYMKKSSILVAPSIWEDPCPLTHIEGLSNGCALITSARGGIPEIAQNNAIMIKKLSAQILYKKIKSLIENKFLLKKYHQLSWNNYNLNIDKFVKKQDFLRKEIFKS
jgi:glycosyltransferase involved in cell wall biosynthesis